MAKSRIRRCYKNKDISKGGHKLSGTKCNKCGNSHNELWPFGGGICDRCLMENFSYTEVCSGVCACLYIEVLELYLKSK